MEKQLMPLSKISQTLKPPVNKSKLAHYVRLGLLVPSSEFPESKQYLYDFVDVKQRLKQIETLQDKGYKLTEMKDKLV